jgi:AAA+ ATPase superfamily predicted ATPase
MDLNVGKPVTGEELIGREEEINEIIQTIKAGQSVALIAPRRFGKTSIMMEVMNRLNREKFFTGSIDIFTVPDIEQLAFEITSQVLKNRKLDEALNKLKRNLGEILTNIKFRKEIEGAEFILGFGKPQNDPWEQLRSSLRFIETFALKYNKKICFAFDEFGDIEKLDGTEIIKLFRGIIQNQKQSVYIFSGSFESVMNKIFVTSKSPFYRMVKIVEPGFRRKYFVN